MLCVGAVIARDGNDGTKEVTGYIIVAKAQRCFFANLPDRHQKEAIGRCIAAGEGLESGELEVGCGLKIGKSTRPTCGKPGFAGDIPVEIKITYETIEIALGKMVVFAI